MNNKSLAESLRALADKVESLPENKDLKIEVVSHWCGTIEKLQAMASLMKKPEADNSRSSHWIKGDFADRVHVTAYYTAGLLGKVRKKRVTVFESEATVDLSRLTAKAEPSHA